MKPWIMFITVIALLLTLNSPPAIAQNYILEKIDFSSYVGIPKNLDYNLQIYSYIDLKSDTTKQLFINNTNKLHCLQLIKEFVKQGVDVHSWDYRIIVGVNKSYFRSSLLSGKYVEINTMPVPVNIPTYFSTENETWAKKVVAAVASNQTLTPSYAMKAKAGLLDFDVWVVNKVRKINFANGPFIMVHTNRIGKKNIKHFFSIPEYQYKNLKWLYSIGHETVMWRKDKNELTDSIVLSFLDMKTPSFKHIDWEDRRVFNFPFNNSNYIQELEKRFAKYKKALHKNKDITFTFLPVNSYRNIFTRKTASFKIKQGRKVKMVHFIMTDDGFGIWKEKNF